MANRLASATSPYLLQHASNPVHWWPWGDEAFAEAARRQVPVLLSIGYAACHWCHVMAHESFEDDATAKMINDSFVAIKVDREERPDVDAVYMQATTALTGQGGWPMTVFLTPQRVPFYAGTYYPPEPHHGLPSFRQLLDAISDAWSNRRADVLGSAEHIVTQLRGGSAPSLHAELNEDDLGRTVASLHESFDPHHAGFGRAPKFPPSMVLEALLRIGGDDAMQMAGQTLEAMARGGIYDQLAGGFARYSVDHAWVVPHFEKMLYDNALLLGVYAHWWRLTEHPIAERVVSETVHWMIGEMRTPEGGFAASLDADSLDDEGHLREGAFYAWNPDQLIAALGPDDGAWAADALEVTAAGTFEHGLSTLQLLTDPDSARLADVKARLLRRRAERSRPGQDDKVVAAWNGWLIEALSQAALGFQRPDWLAAARDAAELIWSVHWVDGRLRRTSRHGHVGEAAGVLEDYAAVAHGFVRLAAATSDPAWSERARLLLQLVVDHFDDGNGGFYDTADDAESLYTRPKDPTDNATPSGVSAAIQAMALYAELTGDDGWAARADRAAASVAELVRAAPRFAGWLLADIATRVGDRRPVQIAIVGDPGETRDALTRAAHLSAPAGSVVVAGPPDTPGMALLAGRSMVDGVPTAYVCRGFVCRLPVTTVQALAAEVRSG